MTRPASIWTERRARLLGTATAGAGIASAMVPGVWEAGGFITSPTALVFGVAILIHHRPRKRAKSFRGNG